ncbi:unnamed protein product [Microthlaspi erraticum]|uniref:Uncharacterized protein n=1 Tax=Microthlaspi erraticum TaxID=1685480 RepID=A0A6D2JJA4_9BRAS|nr:unnamed protein product [Microthlaspi erraticum]
MTLFPTKFENGKIEYKIRYKGRSRPFSRAKALVTSEQSRDPTKLKELLSQVLTITLDGVKRSQLDRQLDRARNQGNSIELPNSTEFRLGSSLLFFNSSFKQGTLVKKQSNKDDKQ